MFLFKISNPPKVGNMKFFSSENSLYVPDKYEIKIGDNGCMNTMNFFFVVLVLVFVFFINFIIYLYIYLFIHLFLFFFIYFFFLILKARNRIAQNINTMNNQIRLIPTLKYSVYSL